MNEPDDPLRALGGTNPPASPPAPMGVEESRDVDNRGASIGQQIIVQGTATFGVASDGGGAQRREIIDFSTEWVRHTCFFGREDVFEEMDAWLAARERGWLLITGGPGLGKSALLHQWLRRREGSGLLTAFHFIRRSTHNWADPKVVQRNLAAQIEVMFPEQRDAEADPTYRLEQLLARVSPLLTQQDRRLVLLVDGLDEAMEQGKDNPIPYILPLELEPGVFVVTASRPQYPHLGWFELRDGPRHRLDLDARMKSNEHAVRRYWETLGPRMTPPLGAELQRAAIEGAQGNLLHAVKMHELWSNPEAVRSPEDVPHGLEGMLDELWQRIGRLPDDDNALAEDGLSLLCAARESLPLAVVESLLGWREGRAERKFLPFVREMLLEDHWQGSPAYRPFHEGLRELVERKLPRSIRAHHATLAEYAAWPVEGDEFRRGYALRHRVEHRVEMGDHEAAAKACMDLGYLTAKACAEGVNAVERDVGLAAGAQSDRAARERLEVLGRLIAASSHWAGEVPEALPALLHDRALTHAPDLLRDLVGLAHLSPEHPRLRHPLQVGAMSRILQGHQKSVNALAVLPDGRIVSGSDDNTVRVWDGTTGRAVATLQGHQSNVNALAVLPDGRVVSGSYDKTVRVWDLTTGRAIATLPGHQDCVNALAVLPDGRVVSASLDKTVRVWDLTTERAVATLRGHKGNVRALAVLPDGRIVSGSEDNTVRVWNLTTESVVATLQGHQDFVNALTVLPDGRVVSGSDDNTVRVWDLTTGRAVATLQGHQGYVRALAVLPDGRVVSGSNDDTVRVWDLTTGRAVATLQGHQGHVNALAVLPDGRVVSGSEDDTVRVWDLTTGRAVATPRGHQGSVRALAVLPDGRVVSGSSDKAVRVWDGRTGRAVATLQGHTSWVYALAVLPDGRVVSGSYDETVRVWEGSRRLAVVTLQGHHDYLNALAVLRDGRVVSGVEDDMVLTSTVSTARDATTRQGHTHWVRALAVLPDRRVVSGWKNNAVRVWDVTTGRVVTTLGGHQGPVMALVVLPNDRIVSGSEDKTVRVWNLTTGRTVAILQGHTHWVYALAVLPNGRVVSGSADKTMRVWDLTTGRAVATLQGHQGPVMALAVLPNGRVVSGSVDNTVRVWDLTTGRTIATIYGDASFYSLACVDQHLIVAGDALGNVWFIDLP